MSGPSSESLCETCTCTFSPYRMKRLSIPGRQKGQQCAFAVVAKSQKPSNAHVALHMPNAVIQSPSVFHRFMHVHAVGAGTLPDSRLSQTQFLFFWCIADGCTPEVGHLLTKQGSSTQNVFKTNLSRPAIETGLAVSLRLIPVKYIEGKKKRTCFSIDYVSAYLFPNLRQFANEKW